MDFWTLALPLPVSLAAVALIGYLFGRRSWNDSLDDLDLGGSRELKRAKKVTRELESISQEVRRSLATHHASIVQFKERIVSLSKMEDATAWQELSDEAERMLKPTLRLSSQIAHAYDEIRQQTNHLMTFTEVRTDPLTNLYNRRAMEETLNQLFALKTRYDTVFAVAMFDIDHFKEINDQHGHLHGDQVLRHFARIAEETARETDSVARFGGEEFVIIMPETDIAGGCIFCERLREKVQRELSLTVSAGVASAEEGDTMDSLLSRSDAALYSAKAGGRNAVFRHTGGQIERVTEPKTTDPSSQEGHSSDGDEGNITLKMEDLSQPTRSPVAAAANN